MLKRVIEFNAKFGLPMVDRPIQAPGEILGVKSDHMQEELEEWRFAWLQRDLEGQLDALVDLVYVALGTVCASGFQHIFEEAFQRVHEKNMQKIKVEDPADSKRNTTFDVRKPAGWEPATFKDLIHPQPLNLFGDLT